MPILYEGRTADGLVKDAPGLDQLFEDMFRDYAPDELAVIKAKYATEGDVLEAPLLIEQKARDMLRHYVSVVLPEGFKAQVVATSRQAAVTYHEKLVAARDALVAELEALPAATAGACLTTRSSRSTPATRFLVRTHPLLPHATGAGDCGGHLRRPQRSRVVVGLGRQGQAEGRIQRFKRKLAA